MLPKIDLRSANHLTKQAMQVALLAFRCARQSDDKRDTAFGVALDAYLSICPDDVDASDKVIAIILDAVQYRPHWLAMDPVLENTG